MRSAGDGAGVYVTLADAQDAIRASAASAIQNRLRRAMARGFGRFIARLRRGWTIVAWNGREVAVEPPVFKRPRTDPDWLCRDGFPHLIEVHKPLFERCVAGETVPVEDVLYENPARPTHIHGVFRPTFGPEGAVRFVSVLVLEITERVEADLPEYDRAVRAHGTSSSRPRARQR